MKKITLLLSAMLLACATNLWAADPVTVTKTVDALITELGWSVSAQGSEVCYTSFNLDENITVSTSGEANCGSVWGTSNRDWRLYQAQKGDVTITAAEGYKINSITLTYGTKNDGILLNGTATCTSGTAITVNDKSITLTVGKSKTGTNGQIKITQFSVIYEKLSIVKTVSVAIAEGQEGMGSVTMSYKANSAATEWTATTDPVEIAGEGEEEFQFVATPAEGYKFAGWTTTGDITLNSTTEATTEGGLAWETSVVTANFERDATLQSLAISGTATKLNYFVGDTFDPAGLVVTATYSDGATDDVTDQVSWTITPAKLALATTSVSVVATWNEVSSAAYEVNGIVVIDAVQFERWVGEVVEGEYLLVDITQIDSIAMNSTIDNKRFQYSKITINEEGKILEPSANIIWTIKRDSAFWTIANGENLAARTGSNNQVKFTTNASDSSRWIITPTEEKGHTIVNYGSNVSGKNATLRRNGTYGFACYGATTGTAPVLYKKVTNETFVTVTVTVNDASMGSVYGGGKYAVGATATLTAIPAAGYKLTGWSNNSEITTTTQSFTVEEDITITANFATGETAIDNTTLAPQVVKTIENGQLIILRDGVKYNAMGVRLQ
ncbi:MAG: bacterial Ig-like domain-containing protein [Paludibacteraceae bacterium]|nr:bacterial Ig-like domain-containing protein [Paludibacteraceae bacterium]